MDGRTILKRTGCDLKRLPLSAVEAFVLSQIDGRLTLDDIAQIVTLDLGEVLRIGQLLLALGAAAPGDVRPATSIKQASGRTRPLVVEEAVRSVRSDPRADAQSIRPPVRTEERARRTEERAPRHPTPRPERRRSRRSLRIQEEAPTAEKAEPARTASKAPRAPSRHALTAEKRGSSPGVKAPSKRPSRGVRRVSESSAAAVTTEARRSSKQALPRPHLDERRRQLAQAVREAKAKERFDLLVRAADEALAAGDVSLAANNYRLALEHHDDPLVRAKLEDADLRARKVRFEKNVALARAAERSDRSAEAATYFARAHEAKPDAAIAERAAWHLCASGGDLSRAIALAERAVAMDAKAAGYRVTLGEVYLAANRVPDAEREASAALELAPNDGRAKALSALVAKTKKGRA